MNCFNRNENWNVSIEMNEWMNHFNRNENWNVTIEMNEWMYEWMNWFNRNENWNVSIEMNECMNEWIVSIEMKIEMLLRLFTAAIKEGKSNLTFLFPMKK